MDLRALWQNVQENVTFLLVCLLVFVGLFIIAMLVERRQYEELELVVNEYTQTFKSTQVTRYCENAVIDAVLSHYIRQAESLGITLDLGFDFPDTIPVDPTELATVFANAIENAIHACEKLPPNRRPSATRKGKPTAPARSQKKTEWPD